MKFSSASVHLALLSASTARAAGTLEFSLRSKQLSHFPDLDERDVGGTSESALTTNYADSIGYRYMINLTVGTPPQPQSVLIDTGSSDTIFLAAESFCTSKKTASKCPGGTYNTSASSTFKMLSPGGINATYGGVTTSSDNDGALAADLVTDVIQTGDLIVGGAHFGAAHQSSGNLLPNGDYIGIMGLAYPYVEAVKEGQPKYPTFVQSLVDAGAVASRLFSLYLNEVSSYGSILFGGLDTEKYTGNLTTFNILPNKLDNGELTTITYFLHLDEVSMTHEDGQQEAVIAPGEQTMPVWPDSGTSDWLVTSEVYSKVINMTGATLEDNVGLTPCSKIANKTSFTFSFSGNGTNHAQLEVPLASFFTPAVLTSGKAAQLGGEDACRLMVSPINSETKYILLGTPIMRAGYWIFDMDNGQISVAQARLSSTTSNVVAVEAGPHGVMNAAKQPSALGANQTVSVDGNATASVSPSLATATNAVGQTSGPEPTVLSGGAAGHMADVTFGASLASALMLSITFAAFML
ncbi:acid protease, partial [Aureobasidium melanogenum]